MRKTATMRKTVTMSKTGTTIEDVDGLVHICLSANKKIICLYKRRDLGTTVH